MSDAVHIISVVRDFAMYDRLVRNNPNNAGAEFVGLRVWYGFKRKFPRG